MKIKHFFSKSKNTEEAAKEIISNIKQIDEKLIIFFASPTYDFSRLSEILYSAFSHCEVIGCTTSGEISEKGFSDDSLVAMSMASSNLTVKSVLFEDGYKHPILKSDEIKTTLQTLGFNPESQNIEKEGFALTLFNGLYNLEEKLLSVIYSIIRNKNFNVLGGTAGDNLAFKETLICHNGKIINNGGLVTFVKTTEKFMVYKETIFKPMGKLLIATKVDVRNRIVYEFNNKPATTEYAKVLGIDERNLSEHFTINPLGRVLGDDIYISTPFQINSDKSISLYCQILENSTIEVLEPLDPIEVSEKTVAFIKETMPSANFALMFNCILRTLYFKETLITDKLTKVIAKGIPRFVGFTTYGEQLRTRHFNQTLVMIVFE
ncbi:FIST signal transduction protein [Clostridium cellulovorans]|nr:FIST N-terminal domain-containing protein [Clostridium cellulovorans]